MNLPVRSKKWETAATYCITVILTHSADLWTSQCSLKWQLTPYKAAQLDWWWGQWCAEPSWGPAQRSFSGSWAIQSNEPEQSLQTHRKQKHCLTCPNETPVQTTAGSKSEAEREKKRYVLPGRGKKEKILSGTTHSLAKLSSTPITSTRIFSDTWGLQNTTKQSCAGNEQRLN